MLYYLESLLYRFLARLDKTLFFFNLLDIFSFLYKIAFIDITPLFFFFKINYIKSNIRGNISLLEWLSAD